MNFNVVTFTPDALSGGGPQTPIVIELREPWKLTGGIKPNVNHAICPYAEFAKFNGNVNVSGTIGFWFSNSPPQPGDEQQAEPDVSIAGVRVYDVQHSEEGIVGTSESGTAQVTVWEIFFTDFRQRFVHPRGGRLEEGLINPDAINSAGGQIDANDSEDDPELADGGDSGGDSTTPDSEGLDPIDEGVNPDRPNSELIQLCLTAMGLGSTTIPAGVDSVDPPRNLHWFGNHAPTELEKLMEKTGCIFLPNPDGSASIAQLGVGTQPNLGGLQQVLNVPLPGIDRRGKNVVFTSYPNSSIATQTLVGVSGLDGSSPANGGNTVSYWQFVAQDSDGTWSALNDLACCSDVAAFIKNGMTGTGVAQADAERLATQLYRCIQLLPSGTSPDNDSAPILLRTIEQDGDVELVVNSMHAFQDETAGLANITSDVRVVSRIQLGGDQSGILRVEQWLGKVTSGASDIYSGFQEPATNDLSVRFTQEQTKAGSDKAGNTIWKPVYFKVGYQQPVGNGAPTPITGSDLDDLVTGTDPDTIIISRPEWVQKTIDGTDVNSSDLQTSASNEAANYLKGSGDTMKIIKAAGWCDGGGLNGIVSEIEWSQQEVSTTFKCGTWFAPTAGVISLKELTRMGDPKSGAYPHEHREHAARAALGVAGSTQPVTFISPPAPAAQSSNNSKGTVQGTVYQMLTDTDAGFGWVPVGPMTS